MSKTAMMELIDKYNEGCGSREFFTYFITNKNELLAKERQQIEDAHSHNRCLNNKTYDCSVKAIRDAKEYYEKKYGGEK
ncbi:MAG TPA: hypothetical protein V6C58_04135 [Allocoleopsis sp.]